MKLTHKIYLLQITLAFILFSFLTFTYLSYEKHYKKDIKSFVNSEVNLHKKQIVSSITNATHKFLQNKKLYLKIHNTALNMMKKDISIDLEILREKLNNKFNLEDTQIDLFLIDKSYTIYKSTFTKDIGFNLSVVTEAKDFLDKTTKDSKVYISNFASTDSLDMRYKLYSYSLLKKDIYLELGFTNNNIHNTLPSIISQSNDKDTQIKLYSISNNSKEWSYYDFSTKDDTLSKEELFQQVKKFPIGQKNYDNILSTHISNKTLSINNNNEVQIITPLFHTNMFSKIGYINIIMDIKVDISDKLKTLQQIKNIFILSIVVISIFLLFIFIYIRNNFTQKIEIIVDSINQKREINDKSLLLKNDELSIVSKEYNNLFKSLNKEINLNKNLLTENKRFIADTVHQIRTPLTNIMMNSEMIKRTQKDNTMSNFVEQINASINMLTNSYEDLSYILSFDSIEYSPTNLCVSKILRKRVAFFTTISKVNFKEIVSNIADDIFFNINEIELERLIDNNISNAIKYGDANQAITINLSKNNDLVTLEFKTYGKPIIDTSKLFEKSYRENEHKRGLGLGLNMVKDICEKYSISYEVTHEKNQNIFRYFIK